MRIRGFKLDSETYTGNHGNGESVSFDLAEAAVEGAVDTTANATAATYTAAAELISDGDGLPRAKSGRIFQFYAYDFCEYKSRTWLI